MFVVADEGFFDTEMIEQLKGYAGILRRDKIHRFQNFRRAGGKVPQIPDGRAHKI